MLLALLLVVCLFIEPSLTKVPDHLVALSSIVRSLIPYPAPFLVASVTAAALLVAGYYISSPHPSTVSHLFSQALDYMHLTLARSRYPHSLPRPLLREQRFAAANGGDVGGLSNEGNTCFMNLVIQALASSRQLLQFLDLYIYQETVIETGLGEHQCVRSGEPKPGLPFTHSFRLLLESLNAKYGRKGKEYSTKQLLAKMPNGPKQNFFSGYNQEDAQEFYQLVMSILEKEHKKLVSPEVDTEKPTKTPDFVDAALVECPVMGCTQLGCLGEVYVPAAQVDPNLDDGDLKLFPLHLMSPVDGVTAERIGCLSCGEVGGIRYLVTSGLSLNLPSTLSVSYHTRLDLEQLMNEWIKPEIIEQVNCNRCGMAQAREALQEKLAQLKDTSTATDICAIFEKRLAQIDAELAKASVSDALMDALTIEQMVRKSNKSKQIYLSRPPPLLLIHINRSVFDPRTYSIVKNPSNVAFPATLDLSRWVVEPQDINMDARLPLRKQDKTQPHDFDMGEPSIDADTHSQTSSLNSSNPAGESVDAAPSQSTNMTDVTDPSALPSNPNLVYHLRSVILHYGTHNYGHYICYRRWRGTWWRISDELVDVVSESEVLSGQGTFMLFYEIDDGQTEDLVAVSDDEAQADAPGPDSDSDQDDNSFSQTESTSDSDSDADAESQATSQPTPPSHTSDDKDDTDFVMGLERSLI